MVDARLRVLILCSHASSLIHFRADLIKDMVAKGHEVIAIAPELESHWSHRLARLGAKYRSVPIERTGMNPLKDLQSLLALHRIIKREKPDVVFAYHAKTIIYGSIASRMCRVPSINVLLAGLGSAFRGTGFKHKVLKAILCMQYKIALKSCKNVFFQNNDDLGEFVRLNLVAPHQTKIINGSGVNLGEFTPQPIPGGHRFLFVGRLIRDKGIFEYMQAARLVKKKYPEASFRVVGPFDTNPTAITPEDMQPFIDDGSIEYLGETNDVRPYLKACTTFVLPSYHEGTPKAVLEAMAVGRPIITTDAPGCRETVIDGVNGFLVPTRNVQALAEKLIWMIEHPEAIHRMGAESLRICREKYDVRKINFTLLQAMGLN